MKKAIWILFFGCMAVTRLSAQFPGYEGDPPVREHSGENWASEQSFSGYEGDAPVREHSGPVEAPPKMYPEYEKLVNELGRLQEELAIATNASNVINSATAARMHQKIVAAHARLSEYINNGRPTLMEEPSGVPLLPPPLLPPPHDPLPVGSVPGSGVSSRPQTGNP